MSYAARVASVMAAVCAASLVATIATLTVVACPYLVAASFAAMAFGSGVCTAVVWRASRRQRGG